MNAAVIREASFGLTSARPPSQWHGIRSNASKRQSAYGSGEASHRVGGPARALLRLGRRLAGARVLDRRAESCGRGMSGGTRRDALETLFAAYLGIRDRILTEQGELRQHVNVFVGKSDACATDGLAMPLADGAEISIIRAIGGG